MPSRNLIFLSSLYLIVSLLLLLPLSIHAESEKNDDVITLDPVTVTGKNNYTIFETGDVAFDETPAFFTIIPREVFDGKITSLSEVIKKEAGIQVKSTGGLGSFSSVSLRGAASEQVMIYLDGVLLNDSSGGGVDLSSVPLGDVAQIEIFRGSTPINFGKASMGGVINIRTLRSKKGTSADVTAGLGSFGTKKTSATLAHKPGKTDILISAGWLSSDNDFEIFNDNGTSWNTDDDRMEKRNNAEFEQGNILARLGWDIRDNFRASLTHQWFHKDQHLPAANNSDRVNTTFDTERNITTMSIIADNLSALDINTALNLGYLNKEEIYDDRGGSIGLGKQYNKYITQRYFSNLFAEWQADFHVLSFNTEVFQEFYDPEDMQYHSSMRSSQRNFLSFGLQDAIMVAGGKLIITPSASYTIIHDDLQSGTSSWGVPLESGSRNEQYFSPSVGGRYALKEWFILKSNLGAYHREPSFFELFGDRGFFIGNPDLRTESGINFDGGFEINHKATGRLERYWIQSFSFSGDWFESHTEDLIARVYDARGVGKSQNIANAVIRGVELSFSVDFAKYFCLTGAYTWQDTVNDSAFKVFNGKQLPGRFQHAYNCRMDLTYDPIQIFLEAVFEEGVFYDSANLLAAPDKKELNAGISYSLGSFLVDLAVNNITDELYEDFNGYPLPGRSYNVSARYKF